jgi:hypothetical protein
VPGSRFSPIFPHWRNIEDSKWTAMEARWASGSFCAGEKDQIVR